MSCILLNDADFILLGRNPLPIGAKWGICVCTNPASLMVYALSPRPPNNDLGNHPNKYGSESNPTCNNQSPTPS